MSDSDLRYTFSCPNCAGSFSIHIERIPPVRARFSCPKCGKPMDFPSRDEARVYMQLQAGGGGGAEGPATAPEPPPQSAIPSPRPPEPAPAARTPPPAAPIDAPEAEKRYAVQKAGFEGDSYDRRAIRVLIRSGAIDPGDMIQVGDDPAVRADTLSDLKSLFELRKSARFTPPAVCRKHTDQLAHYRCAQTGRPLCEECAAERKYGGTSVRVCDHCGGNIETLPVADL